MAEMRIRDVHSHITSIFAELVTLLLRAATCYYVKGGKKWAAAALCKIMRNGACRIETTFARDREAV